jgi:hypothetical protein
VNDNETTIVKTLIGAVALLLILVVVLVFLDEVQDGSGERACMDKIEQVDPGENYNSVDCDL